MNFFTSSKPLLTPEECVKAIGLGETAKPERALLARGPDSNYRNSRVSWIPTDTDAMWLYQKLGRMAGEANKRVGWNFDLSGMAEEIQYSDYGPDNEHYDWHVDLGPKKPMANRKLSIVVQLTDPADYKGGKLELKFERESVFGNTEQGTVTLFPSWCLHRVTPVTRGHRASLALWVSGKAFR